MIFKTFQIFCAVARNITAKQDFCKAGAEDLNEVLSRDLTWGEVSSAIKKLKNGKAAGWDNLVAEVLKNECCIKKFLFHLYEVCWKFCVTPSEWRRGIIHPIPKSVSKDLRCPMSYRGISLLSVPYKASIMNGRLTAWLEEESVIHEAQNGFRKERSCLEHIFVISNLVDTRKRMGLDTFACFVDFQKAYDRVNRAYLWQKLISVGVQEKFVQMIKAMYSGTSSCVRVNGKLILNGLVLMLAFARGVLCRLHCLIFM